MNNNELISGGIFCDIEKPFDCVNHNILLAKLKFYGINGTDYNQIQFIAWIIIHAINCIWKADIKEQNYIMRKRHVIKSEVRLKYNMVSHKVLLLDLYFFSHI
jgi:hypothetical protein